MITVTFIDKKATRLRTIQIEYRPIVGDVFIVNGEEKVVDEILINCANPSQIKCAVSNYKVKIDSDK
jgi:hypothetical protein